MPAEQGRCPLTLGEFGGETREKNRRVPRAEEESTEVADSVDVHRMKGCN
jgi:hypothetical protein